MSDRIQKHASIRLKFPPGSSRNERLAIYRRFLDLEQKMIFRRHRAGESGLKIAALRAAVIDTLLTHLFAAALEDFEKSGERTPVDLCMIALGGYGRKELSPLSDIDFMFLFPDHSPGEKIRDFQKFLTDEILYILWDLNLQVGPSTRTINEALEGARTDIRTKTSLLDSRLITGSKELYEIFHKTYKNFYRNEKPREYLEARLRDQTVRRARYGDTVFLQEPDIKNGVGGLRDYQNALWMARLKLGIERIEELSEHDYLHKNELRDFIQAYDFLLRVRNELHFTIKRPSDLLDLEKQPSVAKHLGYTQENIFERVEHFMRDYYSHARTIFRFSKLLERRLALRSVSGDSRRIPLPGSPEPAEPERRIDGFLLRNNKLTFESASVFEKDPERLIGVFRHRQTLDCELAFELESLIQESLPLITNKVINSPEANRIFREIIRQPGKVYPILDQMHSLGVLGRFVPEFNRLDCLVQHEYYHRYTADVHTLNTIRELDAIFLKTDRATENYREALQNLDDPTLLYLILFLHDLGKAFGIAGHAETGAEIAVDILERLEIPKKSWNLILFTIRNHLAMTRFWQKHDLQDPAMIAAFAERIGDVEKLGFLYVHTFCDARGTASGLWNSYKEMLHSMLCEKTFRYLTAGESVVCVQAERKESAFKKIKERAVPEISAAELEAHFAQLPNRYFLHTETDEIILHLRMIQRFFAAISEASSSDCLIPIIDWKDDPERKLTVVNIVTWDRARLFGKIAGAFARAGLNILSAKAVSRSDHIAIDTFNVIDPGRGPVKSDSAKRIFEKALQDELLQGKDLLPELEAEAEAEKEAKPDWEQERELLHAPIEQKISVYDDLALNRTVIEIQVNDRIGLLYQLSETIFEHGYNIIFARVATERGVAHDTFYIEPRTDLDEEFEEPDLLKLHEDLIEKFAPDAESSTSDDENW